MELVKFVSYGTYREGFPARDGVGFMSGGRYREGFFVLDGIGCMSGGRYREGGLRPRPRSGLSSLTNKKWHLFISEMPLVLTIRTV